jgi:hypothetical protein
MREAEGSSVVLLGCLLGEKKCVREQNRGAARVYGECRERTTAGGSYGYDNGQ